MVEKCTKSFYFISKGLQHFLQAWSRKKQYMGSCMGHWLQYPIQGQLRQVGHCFAFCLFFKKMYYYRSSIYVLQKTIQAGKNEKFSFSLPRDTFVIPLCLAFQNFLSVWNMHIHIHIHIYNIEYTNIVSVL